MDKESNNSMSKDINKFSPIYMINNENPGSKSKRVSEGLGLGIPLAKRHAQNLGGDLILDTTYHEGCRFIVEVPYKMYQNKL